MGFSLSYSQILKVKSPFNPNKSPGFIDTGNTFYTWVLLSQPFWRILQKRLKGARKLQNSPAFVTTIVLSIEPTVR